MKVMLRTEVSVLERKVFVRFSATRMRNVRADVSLYLRKCILAHSPVVEHLNGAARLV